MSVIPRHQSRGAKLCWAAAFVAASLGPAWSYSTPSLTIAQGALQEPYPACVGLQVKVPLTAVLTTDVYVQDECTVGNAVWSWSTVGNVKYKSTRDPGTAWTDVPSASASFDDPAAQDPSLVGTFATAGYWKVTVHAQVAFDGGPCGGQQTVPSDPDLDLIITVVQMGSLTATVPSTPPKTSQIDPVTLALNNWSAPADRSFTSMAQAPASGAMSFDPATAFAAPNALVLFQNGASAVALSTSVTPGVMYDGTQLPIHYGVVQNPGEIQALGAHVPTVSGTGTAGTLSTNTYGSFQVVAYVDATGAGSWQAGDAGVTMPLVLVNAQPGQNRSVAQPANLRAWINATAGCIQVRSGRFHGYDSAIVLDCDAYLVGGGADGQLGLDRVFLGWANNMTASNTWVGTYGPAVSTIPMVPMSNPTDASGSFEVPEFLPGDAAPAVLTYPLLDSGRPIAGTQRDGGADVTFSKSAEVAAASPLGYGQKAVVTAVDGPSWVFQWTHPAHGTTITQASYDFEATVRLVGWTNVVAGQAPTPTNNNSTGFRTFSVIYEIPWYVSGTWNVTAGPALAPLGVPTTAFGQVGTRVPAAPAASTNIEVRPPTITTCWAFDARG